MDDSHAKGNLAMLKVQMRAQEKGFFCCLPTVPQSPYDLVIDENGSLKRTQVKYANYKPRKSSNSLMVRLGSKNSHGRTPYGNSIDQLLIYIPEKDVVVAFSGQKAQDQSTINICLEGTGYKKIVW